jgi:hypothetical protein
MMAELCDLPGGEGISESLNAIDRGTVKPSMHLFAYPEGRMMGLGDGDFGSGLGITPHPSRPGLYSEYPEAAQFHAIAPDQCGFDLAENHIDGLFNVPVVKMRILPCDAQHQL